MALWLEKVACVLSVFNDMRKGCFKRMGGTSKAYLFYPPEDKSKAFWIPRSVLDHVSTLTQPKVGEHILCEIIVEDWWIAKNQHLDKYFS